MATSEEHYDQHLADAYVWMLGGLNKSLAHGAREVEALTVASDCSLNVLDLGAGFGRHAIPLARAGHRVVAVDSSHKLARLLANLASGLSVEVAHSDAVAYVENVDGAWDLVLCLGDTLTHLPSKGVVERLLRRICSILAPGGRCVLSFRDYTSSLEGARRFIPVRSDGDRILTCIVDYEIEHVLVHDLLHERRGDGFHQTLSWYRKLRLDPRWVVQRCEGAGRSVHAEASDSGMVHVIVDRAENDAVPRSSPEV